MSDQARGATAGELAARLPVPVLPGDELRSAAPALPGAGLIAQPVTDGYGRPADLLVPAGDRHLVKQEAEVAAFSPIALGRRAAGCLGTIQARRVMRRHPPAVHVSARCGHAADRMADHHLGVLPVNDAAGRVVGVPTRHALIEAWSAGRLC